MTLYEDAERLALQLEINANAHLEQPGTERRRAAATIRDLLNEIDLLRALTPEDGDLCTRCGFPLKDHTETANCGRGTR